MVPGNSDLAITIARKIIHDYLVANFREPGHTGITKCDFCRPNSRHNGKNSINDPKQCLVESRGNALAGGTGCAYRSCFNDHCAETLFCPQQTALVGD